LDPVPLFDSNSDGSVHTKEYGKNDLPILEQSSKMTEKMRAECRKVVIRNLTYFRKWMDEDSGETDEGLLSRFF
jgi:hypothetical protein